MLTCFCYLVLFRCRNFYLFVDWGFFLLINVFELTKRWAEIEHSLWCAPWMPQKLDVKDLFPRFRLSHIPLYISNDRYSVIHWRWVSFIFGLNTILIVILALSFHHSMSFSGVKQNNSPGPRTFVPVFFNVCSTGVTSSSCLMYCLEQSYTFGSEKWDYTFLSIVRYFSDVYSFLGQ